MDMTPEERAAADAKALGDAKAAEDAKKKAAEADPEYWQKEAKAAFKARDQFKEQAEKNADAAKQLDDLKKAQMTDLEKAQSRAKELEGFETQAKALTDTVTKLLDVEIAGVPEQFRLLIPMQLDPAAKLLWVRNAKEQGLFGAKVPPIGGKLPGGNGGKTIKRSELNALPLGQFKHAGEQIKKGELVLVED
jgi:hypothetical protein